jgi:hypothetical protein
MNSGSTSLLPGNANCSRPVETRVALTYAAVWVIALAAWQHGRPTFIRSPRLVLAHVWEGVES